MDLRANQALALEPRQLFDGALAATLDEPVLTAPSVDARELSVTDKVVADVSTAADGLSAGANSGTNEASRQLLVIDNRLAGWQTFAQSAPANVDVMIIDETTDGLSAVAQRMVSGVQYTSLQIVSHGGSGHLTLGSRSIDASNLSQFTTELAAIGGGLTAQGDILLYGCDIAAGNYGADFLSALARATQADVAASSDLTGAARLGGDWDLEVATGVIEAPSAVSVEAKQSYDGLLVSAALTVVQSSESSTAPGVLSTTAPLTAETLNVAVGEVVRLRAVVAMPEDGTPLATELRVALADGLCFLNDGSATVALVSDAGMLESDTLSGLADMADGTADGSISTFSDVRTLRPTFVLPNSGATNAVVNGTTNPGAPAGAVAYTFGSGDDLRVLLGQTDNLSTDADVEWVIVEFNVVVVNQISNQDAVGGIGSATTLPVSFTLERGGVMQSLSDTDNLRVQEPLLSGLDKRVLSVTGNTVTFEARFTNSGNTTLHDVRVFDNFAGATNLSFGATGTLPGGAVNNSTATALDVSLPTVAAGATVTLTYTATIADLSQSVPSRDVVVTGTSLSTAGTSLTTLGGEDGTGAPIAGIPVSLTKGERTGADGSGAENLVLNNYAASNGAGLSTLQGHLWDDTLQFNNQADAGLENDLAGVTVTLTWAGLDNIFGNADDVVRTTTTLATTGPAGPRGDYYFGGLASGDYRISVPTTLADASSGALVNSFDRGAAGPLTDGIITLTIPEGSVDAGDADFAYIKQNEAPTISTGPSRTITAGAQSVFAGADQISIADPDLLELFNPAVLPPSFETLLQVSHGTLSLAATPGVTIVGNGTGSVVLTGTRNDINLALATLSYSAVAGYVGSDTLTVTVNDHGNFGDFDGDHVPNEGTDDNRYAVANIDLTVLAGVINEPPVAPSITVIIDRNATLGSAESLINGMPAPTDPDVPVQPLTVTVLSVPAASSGTLYRPDGTPVQAGQTLSIANLQNLSFVPNGTDPTAPRADGLIPAGSMQYRVSDPLGASAQGSINLLVNPRPFVAPPLPPVAPPVSLLPPTVPPPNVLPPFAPFVPSLKSPPFSDLTSMQQDFDPYEPWSQNRLSSMNDEARDVAVARTSPQTVKAANLTQEERVEAPKPKAKVKVKAKVMQRSDASKAIPIERLEPFTEQVKAARQPFRRAAPVLTNTTYNSR